MKESEAWRTLPGSCSICGKQFTRKGPNNIYCSGGCLNKANRDLHGYDDDSEPYSRGVIGAIHELQVAADLMKKGWWVFRALSPDGPIDLIAVNGNKTLRIQVRKARRSKRTGNISFPAIKEKDKQFHDVVALSFTNGKIMYLPDCITVPSA